MEKIKSQLHNTYNGGGVSVFLDQASKLGYAVWEGESLVESGILVRGSESLQEYGQTLHLFLADLSSRFQVDSLFYEEVFIKRGDNAGSVLATESLFYIKHKVKDYCFLNKIDVFGLDNATWKKFLASPASFGKVKGESDKDKVRHLVTHLLPHYTPLTEDECDAVGMGLAVMVKNKGSHLDVARYNKKLPVHWGVSDFSFFHAKLPKRFSRAMDVGGLVELEVNKSHQLEELFLRKLTHEDVLAYVVVEPSYKYYYYYRVIFNVLESQIGGSELFDNQAFILYASRKKSL